MFLSDTAGSVAGVPLRNAFFRSHQSLFGCHRRARTNHCVSMDAALISSESREIGLK
jgi:hypothetical protein